MNEWRNIKEK